MHPRRLARLNELILQTVSRLTLNLQDPGIGFITVTGAEVSPDVSLAKIFYSVYGTEMEKQMTAEALERAKPRFRREVARLENLKKAPALLFVYDAGVERADRVFKLLDTIEKERQTDGKDNPAD